MLSYDKKNYEIYPLSSLPSNIKFQFKKRKKITSTPITIEKNPISYQEYHKKFAAVQAHIRSGESYLLNLTSKTSIKTPLSLEEIYTRSDGKYKLLYKDQFTCFSPESFCEIYEDRLYTYPMKGTIDANIPNAKEVILKDQKELAEHTMVVDLLRNDLSTVATNVKVERFRYTQKIKAGKKELLQISSKISGKLEKNWQNRVGDIIDSLTPAGSITGTPKRKTVEIIEQIEGYDRGYFTGIFGVFDGVSLKSAVMIRFIQKIHKSYIYKSGGGITCDSDPKKEYQEMIDKVYIP